VNYGGKTKLKLNSRQMLQSHKNKQTETILASFISKIIIKVAHKANEWHERRHKLV